MNTLPTLLLLVTTTVIITTSQSGRRITTPRSAPTAPIQPSLTPEPELPETRAEYVPESLREREIKAFKNGSFRLADFNGKVVVINLWASWCGPCRREVPEYERVRKAYIDRDVEFIALTTEDPRTSSDRVNKFLRDVDFGFRLGWADREMASALMFGKSAIPQTLVLDGDLRIVNRWTGYSAGQSGTRLRQAIERAIVETPKM